jgi:hypothetical protein
MRAPHAALAARRGIFIRRRFPRRGSCSSRCRFPPSEATVFRRGSFGCVRSGVARERMPPGDPDMRVLGRSLALAADPLRPSAEGAKPDDATSDTPCRYVGADARSPNLALARRLSFVRQRPHAARTPTDATRLEVTPLESPECLPSIRCPTSRPSEALRDPCDVRAKVLAPLSPAANDPSPSNLEGRRGVLPRAVLVCLAARLDDVRKTLRTDFCQPTHDTSTRRPLDSQARACALRPLDASPTEIGFFRAAPDHLAAIRPRLGPRLTTWLPASAALTHERRSRPLPGDASATMPSRRCHDSAFSTELMAGERPLTLPVAAAIFRADPEHRRSQNRFRRPSVKRDGFPGPERLPSMKCSQERRPPARGTAVSDLREPATGLVV